MDIEQVKELIALIDQSSLTEFDFQKDNYRLILSKNGYSETPVYASPETPAPSAARKPQETAGLSVPVPAETPAEKQGHLVKSPIVGVVYLAPTPEAAPYVQEGSTVEKGQVVCLVEAMKLMNEIKSDYNGSLVEVLVENGQVVEYNQPLFRII